MKFDPAFLSVFSDLLVNLSAGWFGVIFIISPTIKRAKRANFLILTVDLIFAIVSLLIAFMLRKFI